MEQDAEEQNRLTETRNASRPSFSVKILRRYTRCNGELGSSGNKAVHCYKDPRTPTTHRRRH
jgi:hypothetical protein